MTYIAILLFLGVAGLASILLWSSDNAALSSLGLNALTETLGIAATVLIIDQMLRRRESARLLPQRAAAYDDVRLLTTHVIGLWREAFERAVSGDYPASAVDLFSPSELDRLSASLDLDSSPNVIPKRTWWEWIPAELARHKQLAERILERHSQVLAPAAYRAVHRLATACPAEDVIQTIKQLDEAEGIPRPRHLGAYWMWSDPYLESVRMLIGWCSTEAKALQHASDEKPFLVDSRGPHPGEWSFPPCQMLPEKLAAQIEKFREWQSKADLLNAY